MKKIPVGDVFALVDDADYERMSKYHWYARVDHHSGNIYAVREISKGSSKNRKRSIFFMHREILGLPKGFSYPLADHRNGNTLDNQRNNLRKATHTQSAMNRKKRSDSKNMYKGTAKKINHRNTNPVEYWCARIKIGDKRMEIGYFKSELEAALKYDELAKKHYGEYARTNFGNE